MEQKRIIQVTGERMWDIRYEIAIYAPRLTKKKKQWVWTRLDRLKNPRKYTAQKLMDKGFWDSIEHGSIHNDPLTEDELSELRNEQDRDSWDKFLTELIEKHSKS
jgi:hypothetical protein